jgi:hypothetical protein
MERSTLIGIGAIAAGVIVAGVALRRREGSGAPEEPLGPCCGQPVCGGEARHPVAVPGGWRRATGAEAGPYVGAAQSILSAHYADPYGTVIPIDADTAAMVEQHCHEPGGPVKPWGYHHGITLLKAA